MMEYIILSQLSLKKNIDTLLFKTLFYKKYDISFVLDAKSES